MCNHADEHTQAVIFNISFIFQEEHSLMREEINDKGLTPSQQES